MKNILAAASALALLFAAGSAIAQDTYKKSAETEKRTKEAEAIASQPGEDFRSDVLLCKTVTEMIAFNRSNHPAPLPAVKVFDNLYYVGTGAVSSWAVDTSDGIILIDTLNNTAEADQFILGGFKKLGLDPMRIKYIVLTHGHGDHVGGAKELQAKIPGVRILMSAADWIYAGQIAPQRHFEVPKKDMVITDGQKLTLGGETITMYLSPGHTPGTISMFFPVKDHGVSHNLAMWGGRPWSNKALEAPYLAGYKRFRQQVADGHVDGLIANHPYWDNSQAKLAAIVAHPNGPNPYLESPNDMKRLAQIESLCLQNQVDYNK